MCKCLCYLSELLSRLARQSSYTSGLHPSYSHQLEPCGCAPTCRGPNVQQRNAAAHSRFMGESKRGTNLQNLVDSQQGPPQQYINSVTCVTGITVDNSVPGRQAAYGGAATVARGCQHNYCRPKEGELGAAYSSSCHVAQEVPRFWRSRLVPVLNVRL